MTIGAIPRAALHWRAGLDAGELGRRKGAIIERLVENRMVRRFGRRAVHIEIRMVFKNNDAYPSSTG